MGKLGHFAFRMRNILAAGALVVAIAAAIGGRTVYDNVKPFGFQDPNSDSSRAYEDLRDATGERPIPEVELLVEAGSGDPLPAARRAAQELRSVAGIQRVITPDTDPSLVSTDRRMALVVGFISADITDISQVGTDVKGRFSGDRGVVVGGAAVTVDELTKTTQDDLQRIELFALPLLLLLSFLVFRGLVAALLPVLVGALSILTTLLLLNALTTVVDIDTFAINIVTGLGLGLAIDYSLFLVTRFREELDRRDAVEASLAATTASIGRMVVFSGMTVAVSLIALCIFPQRFLYSIGIGGALVALSSAAVCLLFLPALLAMLGHRVNALAPVAFQGAPSERRWFGIARFVLTHPVSVAICAIAVMVVAGLPFLRVELTQANAKILPEDASARQVDDAIDEHFSSDPADRIVVVASNGPVARAALLDLRRQSTVSATQAPVRLPNGIYRVDAQLSVAPFSAAALDTVRQARSQAWARSALIGGSPAELVDQRHSLGAHLPWALGFIIVSTALLLFVMTGSAVLPVIALAMNTLTVCVAFGVLVFVFQDGRLEGLLGYTSQGALDTSMPILLFAVAFGLSTDYGVFLLQRIGEARRDHETEDGAIAEGVAASGRVITAAALLFAVAMGAFVFSELVYVKEVSVGAAVAVLVDAFIVRTFLFPAILGLLGEWAWWSPRWLTRVARIEYS
ncbi:MAG TPA: MMPL family transporter [Solirubrobacterales bacterium]|nr:MMPL family transporter [Solirubrobacterales bacterium]